MTGACSSFSLKEISFSIDEGSFTLLCGMSASGKSTLLHSIKPELAPVGKRGGKIEVFNKNVENFDMFNSAQNIGFVAQSSQAQIVTDLVWQELAFPLENLGVKPQIMRRRVAEIAHFFGIANWFNKKTSQLSGGQIQILNLASVLTTKPKILLLDEPTAQLDPIAANQFLQELERVNLELGLTILIASHSLQELLPLADQVLFLEGGRLAFNSAPQNFVEFCATQNKSFLPTLPHATQIAVGAQQARGLSREACGLPKEACGSFNGTCGLPKEACGSPNQACGSPSQAWNSSNKTPNSSKYGLPLSTRQGREFLQNICRGGNFACGSAAPSKGASESENATQKSDVALNSSTPGSNKTHAKDTLLSAKNLWFSYGKGERYILQGASLELKAGEVHALLGSNASGKSTLLKLLSGACKQQRGKVKRKSGIQVCALFQDPRTLFVCDTLIQDLQEYQKRFSYSQEKINELLREFQLTDFANMHPFDLSGGQLQRAAILKLLLLEPDVLLLDEPVKGLDAKSKAQIVQLLKRICARDKAILVVSHDIDFAAQVADKCSMIFGGQILCTDTAKDFFANNFFYTTQTKRITQGLLDGCILPENVLRRLNGAPRHNKDVSGEDVLHCNEGARCHNKDVPRHNESALHRAGDTLGSAKDASRSH